MGDGRRLVRYQDRRGQMHRLTAEQWHYLDTAAGRHGFEYGWGGLRSTLTVRILEERGLITLDRRHYERDSRGSIVDRWKVTGLSALGRAVYDASTADDWPRGAVVESGALTNE
ncbi:hypothetical protein AB0E01_23180 [Nocardia vinacea]|uniref:hypothetical protein n=1 Tax=Nocardia vinacea TaxID=96468 RepID=UPI0033D3710D